MRSASGCSTLAISSKPQARDKIIATKQIITTATKRTVTTEITVISLATMKCAATMIRPPDQRSINHRFLVQPHLTKSLPLSTTARNKKRTTATNTIATNMKIQVDSMSMPVPLLTMVISTMFAKTCPSNFKSLKQAKWSFQRSKIARISTLRKVNDTFELDQFRF